MKLDDKFREIKENLKEDLNEKVYHPYSRKEALKIGASCRILKKEEDRDDFIDIAIVLLSYSPQLGFFITSHFSIFEPLLGWDPFGAIMDALSHIDSLPEYFHFGGNIIEEKPEVLDFINNEQQRIEKAGKLLAVAILTLSRNIKKAKRMCRKKKTFSPSVREAVAKALKSYNEALALAIIK